MRLGFPWVLVGMILFMAGCASVSRPPVLPPPPTTTVVAPEASTYRSPQDAPRVLDAIDHQLASRQATAADLSTPDLELYSNLLLTGGRLGEADQALQILNQRQPGNRGTLVSLALVAEAEGHGADAQTRLAVLEAAFPGDPEAAGLRARLLLAKGDKAGAKAAWQAVLTHGDDAQALEGLATLALGAKKPGEALPLADRAVQAAPTDDEAWALRARVETELGQYPRAKRDLDQAISLAPDDPWHHLDRGKLAWLHLYDSPAAQADLEFATAKDPKDFFGWSALAEVYEDLNQPRQAYAAWLKALALRPDYRFAYPSVAMLSFRYQDFSRAAEYAREAAKDYPAEYGFPFVEALSLKALGRWPEAVTSLEKARPRFVRGSTVDEFFRFLLTPGTGADYFLNTALTQEKQDNIRLRIRFYQGCYYALIKSPGAAKAAFDEVGASSLQKIPEIPASKDWLDHGF